MVLSEIKSLNIYEKIIWLYYWVLKFFYKSIIIVVQAKIKKFMREKKLNYYEHFDEVTYGLIHTQTFCLLETLMMKNLDSQSCSFELNYFLRDF